MPTVYKRVLLKLSGEALAGDKHFGLDNDSIVRYCTAIKECVDMGVQIGIVVGGGNFWRGRTSGSMDRIRADHIGMLATTMNALAVSDALESMGVSTRVQTAVAMTGIADPFDRDAAVRHLEKGRVVIFGCGTGLPFFSTDTTATLRGAQIGAEVILKGTMVDGVYDSDPKKNPNAAKYDELTFTEVLEKDLKVMDSTAASMCRESKISIMVFNIEEDPNNLVRAMRGEKVGTIVKEA